MPFSLRRGLAAASATAVLGAALAVVTASAALATTGADIANLALANVGKGAGWCNSVHNNSNNSLGQDVFNGNGTQDSGSCTPTGSGSTFGYGEFWCGDFATWVWANAAGGTIDTSGLNAAAGSFYVYGNNNGTLHTSASYVPQVGDAVVYDFSWNYGGPGVPGADHVGLVTAVNPDGSIQTVNGDWGGSGTEAAFADSSSVQSFPISAAQVPVGSRPDNAGMIISGYVTPVGLTNSPPAPSVRITNPGSGASVSGNVTLSAAVSDSASGVTFSTQFYVTPPGGADAAVGGPQSGSAPSVTWDTSTLPAGTYTVKAVSTAGNAQGTSPSTTASVSAVVYNSPMVAFQANNGNLYTYDVATGGSVNVGLGMEAGTSPSIANDPSGGGYQVAFVTNTGELYIHDTATNSNVKTGIDPASGTSPSIAVAPSGGYQVAYQGSNGHLFTYNSATGHATDANLGMYVATDPSIAVSSSGAYMVAFQANNGIMYTYDPATGNSVKSSLGMEAATDASIAADPSGGFEVAFQANTGILYTYNTATGNSVKSSLGMDSGTSPSIAAASSGDPEVAFQANTGIMYTYNPVTGVSVKSSLGMESGTNPSIAAASGGFEVAFQANSDILYTYDTATGNSVKSSLGMEAATNPSITD